MLTQPTPPSSPTPDHQSQVRTLASQIGLNPGSAEMLIQDHAEHLPVLLKVLDCFVGGFTWRKAFPILHSDQNLANDLIYGIALAMGYQLPQRPLMDSHASKEVN